MEHIQKIYDMIIEQEYSVLETYKIGSKLYAKIENIDGVKTIQITAKTGEEQDKFIEICGGN